MVAKNLIKVVYRLMLCPCRIGNIWMQVSFWSTDSNHVNVDLRYVVLDLSQDLINNIFLRGQRCASFKEYLQNFCNNYQCNFESARNGLSFVFSNKVAFLEVLMLISDKLLFSGQPYQLDNVWTAFPWQWPLDRGSTTFPKWFPVIFVLPKYRECMGKHLCE